MVFQVRVHCKKKIERQKNTWQVREPWCGIVGLIVKPWSLERDPLPSDSYTTAGTTELSPNEAVGHLGFPEHGMRRPQSTRRQYSSRNCGLPWRQWQEAMVQVRALPRRERPVVARGLRVPAHLRRMTSVRSTLLRALSNTERVARCVAAANVRALPKRRRGEARGWSLFESRRICAQLVEPGSSVKEACRLR